MDRYNRITVLKIISLLRVINKKYREKEKVRIMLKRYGDC